jgi:hypothetical protein
MRLGNVHLRKLSVLYFKCTVNITDAQHNFSRAHSRAEIVWPLELSCWATNSSSIYRTGTVLISCTGTVFFFKAIKKKVNFVVINLATSLLTSKKSNLVPETNCTVLYDLLCCGFVSGTGSERIRNFWSDPETELEILYPEAELEILYPELGDY